MTIDRTSTALDPDGKLTTVQYDAASRRTTLSDNDGVTRKYQYDNGDRLTTQIELNASSVPIATIVDTYDKVGNRTGRNQNGTISTWTYDTSYRLVSQIKSGERATFVYDNAGNTSVKWQEGTSPMSFVYDAANRIVTVVSKRLKLIHFQALKIDPPSGYLVLVLGFVVSSFSICSV